MNKKYIYLSFLLLLILLSGCRHSVEQDQGTNVINATEHGLSALNHGEANSAALQSLIDRLSDEGGGTVYIPCGEYEFADNASQTIGSHCIKMRSGVSIVGEGDATVLMPIGNSSHGLDMFYFNDYLDTGVPNYLENCSFSDFVIDATETSCRVYTSAGKGFMFNLFKNCHFKNVTVKNTDATGFGIDCPIDSSIINCTATGCGKAATDESSGASGFGIGYGYSENEGLLIRNCIAKDNKKFGVFFEHQGRFNDEMYSATDVVGFVVKDCVAKDNLYNFGGICATGIDYDRCLSIGAVVAGFYLDDCSASIKRCIIVSSSVAVKIDFLDNKYGKGAVSVTDCAFYDINSYDVEAYGRLDSIMLNNNRSWLNSILLNIDSEKIINENNSWNQ